MTSLATVSGKFLARPVRQDRYDILGGYFWQERGLRAVVERLCIVAMLEKRGRVILDKSAE